MPASSACLYALLFTLYCDLQNACNNVVSIIFLLYFNFKTPSLIESVQNILLELIQRKADDLDRLSMGPNGDLHGSRTHNLHLERVAT